MAHPHAIAATATALLHRLARDCPRSAFLSEPTFSLRHLAGPLRHVPAEGMTLWVWRIQPTSTATWSPPISAPDGGLPCAVKGLRLEHVTTESKPR